MNKKLLFAAIGAALSAAPMVVVHADTALYGHFHESFDNINNDNSKNGFTSSNSTRIGVKGNEDLGGGLKAIYQLESGVLGLTTGATDSASQTAATGFGAQLRNSYLGFAGSWGAVKVGRYDSPFKELGRALDNFNEEVGDLRNILSGSSGGASIYDNRVSNMIRYESPSMSGLTANFLHSSSDGKTGTQGPGGTGNSVNSLGVNWTGMGFFVGGAYQKDGFQENGTTITKKHDNAWRLAGSYSMDDWMVGLLYEDLKDIGGADLEQKAKGVVASYKLANNLIKFHYVKADDQSGVCNPCSGTGGKLWALGVDHSFSKATLVYVNYAEAKNDNNTKAYSVISGNGGHGEDELAIANGKKVKGVTAGMILNF